MCELQDRFTREIQLRDLSPRTIRNYLSTIRKLAGSSSKPFLDLTRDDVAGFLHHELTVEKLASASINLHIGRSQNLLQHHGSRLPGDEKHLPHESARNIACRSLTIPLADFISRFLLHAVPSGFVRVRYYGFLSNRNRGENMAPCRAAVSGESEAIDQEEASVTEQELNAAETVLSFPVCPHCLSRKQTLAREIPKRSDVLYQQVA